MHPYDDLFEQVVIPFPVCQLGDLEIPEDKREKHWYPNWEDEDKHDGPSKTSVLRVFGALDTHVHFQVIAIALEINAVEGLEDSRGVYWIDQEHEAQHREVEG